MFSASFHGVSRMLNASTPFCRTPAFCGSSCVTPSSVTAFNCIPCSGTTSSVPRCLFASRNKICGTVQALAVFAPGPERVMMNCCCPSVLPVRFKVMTRPASIFNSVQWLIAAPLMDSTSKPSGITKLNLKIPARVIVTSGGGSQHRAVFAQRKRVLRFHPHVRLDRRWPSTAPSPAGRNTETRGARSVRGIAPRAAAPRRPKNLRG